MSGKKPRNLPARPPEYGDEPELPYWPTFIEKVLLTIIDANPDDVRPGSEKAADSIRQRRLDNALDALFGQTERRGNKHIYLLHAAMAAAKVTAPSESRAAFEQAKLPDLPPELRTEPNSKRSVFAQKSHLTAGNSAEAREQRLKRFERQHRAYLRDAAIFRHHPEEEDMLRDLNAIAQILIRWNIPSRIDVQALGMASLWGSKSGELEPRTSHDEQR